MRKLTVKNFSVIKEAELEFGKITVLIGPQSSGKSLLCKLAYFLSWEVINIAVGRIMNKSELPAFLADLKREFATWFPKSGWGERSWSVCLILESFTVTILSTGSPGHSEFTIDFNSAFTALYEAELGKTAHLVWPQIALEIIPFQAMRKLMGRGTSDETTFIPSERSYFVDTEKGYRVLGSQPDPIAVRFARFYSSGLNLDVPKPRIRDFLRGDLARGEDSWLFKFEDGRILPLGHLSSGNKELLPLLAVLQMLENQRPIEDYQIMNLRNSGNNIESREFDDFFIEEPETHIFPETQYELVRYLAELSNDRRLRSTFVVTTHSPYILSSFNNLIEAGQVVRDHPELRDEVAKIIPEQYWIKDGDFKAYSIHEGKLESILNQSGFIEGNYLDQISDVIGDEFDKLLRLEYDHSEAS